jgi:hypothetical protein
MISPPARRRRRLNSSSWLRTSVSSKSPACSKASGRNAPNVTVSALTGPSVAARVQPIPPKGLSIAHATARSVGVVPVGTRRPPTFQAPVRSESSAQRRR